MSASLRIAATTGNAPASAGVKILVLVILAIPIAFWIGCILASYDRAKKVRDETGRPPWGLAPWGWGLLCVFAAVPGLICVIIASRSARSRAAREGAQGLSHGLPGAYLPPPFAPPIEAAQPPMTVAEAWAPPAADRPVAPAFPPPAVPPPAVPAVTAGSRTAVDVLPDVKSKQRFR